MKRAIVTYAAGAHEELLDVALPTYKDFAHRHGYDFIRWGATIGKAINLPPAWNKIPILLDALDRYDEVVWFDCDLVIVDPHEDFPTIVEGKVHSMVRHFENNSEVPNSGVWRVHKYAVHLLNAIYNLEVFTNHGWWEQAALLTLMGYCVPPEGSRFSDTKCRCVNPTKWYSRCQFIRLCWNSHPNYRAEHPRIVHCSYPDMPRRLEVMRALVKDPTFDYPKYEMDEEEETE